VKLESLPAALRSMSTRVPLPDLHESAEKHELILRLTLVVVLIDDAGCILTGQIESFGQAGATQSLSDRGTVC
jgi:hypothetical protein